MSATACGNKRMRIRRRQLRRNRLFPRRRLKSPVEMRTGSRNAPDEMDALIGHVLQCLCAIVRHLLVLRQHPIEVFSHLSA